MAKLQASSWERVSLASKLIGSLHVALCCLLSLLSRSQYVDFLARPEKAAVVLLLDLGSNIVKGHECRSSVYIILVLHSGCVSGPVPV